MYPIRPYPEVFADRLPWYEEVRTNFMQFVDAVQLEHDYYVAFPQTFLLPSMVQTLEYNVREARKYIKSVNDYIESVPYLQSLTLYDRKIDVIDSILEDINLHEKKILQLCKDYTCLYKYTYPALVLPPKEVSFVPEEGQEDFQIA